jgi:hypothetical protein
MMVLPLPMEILQKTRLQMHLGHSVSTSLKVVLEDRPDLFSKSLHLWLVRIEAGHDHRLILENLSDLGQFPQRRLLVNVFERGIKGASIDGALADLEKEFFFSIENNFERQLQLLPLKLMIPLTLCILPSVMMLILGPFLFSMKGGF